MTLQSLRKQAMKTDMGEQKNPSTPQPEKKAQHYYFTTEWRLGIREVRLSRRATPDIFSVSHTCGTLKTQLFTYRYYVTAYQKVL